MVDDIRPSCPEPSGNETPPKEDVTMGTNDNGFEL